MKNPCLLISFFLSFSVSAMKSEKSCGLVFNISELTVKNGEMAAYDRVAESNITKSLASEDGTLGMYSIKRKSDTNQAYMIEIYSDSRAYQKHKDSPQYKEFLIRSPEILDKNHKRMINLTPKFMGDKKLHQTKYTINNLVIVEVKPEFNAAFSSVVVPEMKQSLKVENGVLAMYAGIETTNPTRWYFYEIYASEADYQKHRQTPHFKDYLKLTANMTTRKDSIPVKPEVLMNKGGLIFVCKN
ncbi:putative quinol monooxygenase [Pantoea cypripedii]|uniref:Antibiotic biosynthesis monooxygenase n=1 Tax=Pantoea cypripedii TaxID=55209 RepID=A0A1X1EKH2_PANCY|nr:antibiotic biosynthesis monooxygenase [Pantoea cypripedii]MBP2199018.1 quinol monooxygenase YgiN [Pantoea cypripedii]ORM89437.1 antibiotic biosynthesis monooxygenase [Pantoea cypripedii]